MLRQLIRIRPRLIIAATIPLLVSGCGGSGGSGNVISSPVPAHYTYTDITPPGPALTQAQAVAINNSGQVLINTNVLVGGVLQYDSYIDNHGTYVDLNKLEAHGPTNGKFLNDAGQALYLDEYGTANLPSLYSGGVASALPPAPIAGDPIGFSAAGDAIISSLDLTTSARFSGGTWTTLSIPPGFTSYERVGLSSSGAEVALTDQGLVVNTSGVISRLGQLPSGGTVFDPFIIPVFIDKDGNVAVNEQPTSGPVQPVAGNVTTGLFKLPIPSSVTSPPSIHIDGQNNKGRIVGVGNITNPGQERIVVWANGQAYDITAGANLPPLYSNLDVTGINDQGQICGTLQHPGSGLRAFLLTPAP